MSATRGKYLHHITLTTGHSRRSYRDEVADDVVELCSDLLTRSRRGPVEIPSVDPPCTLQAIGTRKGLMCTIAGPDDVNILTMVRSASQHRRRETLAIADRDGAHTRAAHRMPAGAVVRGAAGAGGGEVSAAERSTADAG